jgi:hypothetical protein
MTDADFRDLFARVEQPFEPRPEFVARLLSDIDTVAAPSGAVPDTPGTSADESTEPNGSRPKRAYLAEPPDHEMVAPRPRAPKRRAIAALTAVAAVIVAAFAVAVTRPSTHHQTNNVPSLPVAPATTTAPPTTGVPTTLAPSTRVAVTITPSSGLTDQQLVHVVGKGFDPGTTYTATECAATSGPIDPSIDCTPSGAPGSGSGTADATGTVSMYVMVQKIALAAGMPAGVDCTTAAGGCAILVGTGGASISFASTTEAPTTAPLPAGTVTITPSTGLIDTQVVHVVGKGFVAGLTYTATECANKGAAIDPSTDCADSGQQGSGSAIADATGTVSIYVMVSIHAPCKFDCPVSYPQPPPDCATAPGCVIRVSSGNQEATGSISFPFPLGPS